LDKILAFVIGTGGRFSRPIFPNNESSLRS